MGKGIKDIRNGTNDCQQKYPSFHVLIISSKMRLAAGQGETDLPAGFLCLQTVFLAGKRVCRQKNRIGRQPYAGATGRVILVA